MAAFKDIALRYRPDFLIEVLTGTAEALERLDYLHAYETLPIDTARAGASTKA